MNFLDKAMDWWRGFSAKVTPVLAYTGDVFREVGKVFYTIGSFLFKTRKIFLAVPVIWGAVYLAIYNEANLPAIVGLDLQISGDFNLQLVRELAVLGPFVVTAVCVLLMFCSRRILTPWLVSMFSLFIPVIIYVMNTFPA